MEALVADRAEFLIQRAEAAGQAAHAAETRRSGGNSALAALARAWAVINALKAALRQVFLDHGSPHTAFAPTQPAEPAPTSHVIDSTMGVGGTPVRIEYDIDREGVPCILAIWFNDQPPYLGDLEEAFSGWQVRTWNAQVEIDAMCQLQAHAQDETARPAKNRTHVTHNRFLDRPYSNDRIKGGA
jgi:hypothetical protein